MALNVELLTTNISLAFSQNTWESCASLLGDAIDIFITGGLITTTVIGTVYPPFPLIPYPASGVGEYNKTSVPPKGSMNTPGLPMLKSTLMSKFLDRTVVWALVGEIIASAIDIYIGKITLTTKVSSILEGTGIGNPGCINTAASYPSLVSQLTLAFTNKAFSDSWETVNSYMANSINTYIIGSIITTIDNGVSPPNSWSGNGTGSIS